MRFDYDAALSRLMIPEIMNTLTAIHEYRGRQDLYLAAKPAMLERLCETAKIQSTESSNRIENIKTSKARLHALMAEQIRPKSRDEREIAGYRFVLNTIHTDYASIPLTSNVILQLHRDLFRFTHESHAGHWKDSDNAIMERTVDGGIATRFVPTSAVATPEAMEMVCTEYKKASDAGIYDPLLIIALFTFDFVCIHPFTDGNGRMSRLLTLLLLYQHNYFVGRYVSLEKGIEDTKESYYEALAASSVHWQEGTNDAVPFITYLLGVILGCYKTLDERISLFDKSVTGEDLVRTYFENHVGSATKREITEACPSVSAHTIERALQRMVDQGEIEQFGAARATAYRKILP